MYICPNCNATSEQPTNFCANCGASMMVQEAPAPVEQPEVVTSPVAEEIPVVQAEPVVTPPAYAQPTYEQPAPTYEQPQYQQPQYQQPAYTQQPQYQYVQPVQVAAPSLGKVITGMALSIAGLAFAGLGLLYTLMFLAVETEVAFAFSLVMSFFSFPLSLVGFILSKNNVNAGSTSAMSRIGKILGLIGIIASGVMLFLGFIGIAE